MINVRMSKTWSYWLDHDGNVQRTLPAGLVFELDLDTAAAAIAEGAGEAVRGDSPELAAAVSRHKQLIENLAAGMTVEQAYLSAQGAAGGEDTQAGGSGHEPPPPAVTQARLTKAVEIDGERYAKGTLVDGDLAERLVAEGKAAPVAA